jgi:hypothetical protein
MFSLRLKSRSPTGLDLGDQLEEWDMALEALRDKESWKHKEAGELRAGEFGNEEIKK